MFEEEEDWQEGDANDYKGQEGDPQAQGEGAVPPLKALHRHVRHPIPPAPVRLQCKAAFVKACYRGEGGRGVGYPSEHCTLMSGTQHPHRQFAYSSVFLPVCDGPSSNTHWRGEGWEGRR